MGSGEVGGNRSVHWKIRQENGIHAEPVAGGRVKVQGGFQGIGGIGRPTQFKVKLRFSSREAAEEELRRAIASVKRIKNGAWISSVRVDAINRKKPTENPPWEVKINW